MKFKEWLSQEELNEVNWKKFGRGVAAGAVLGGSALGMGSIGMGVRGGTPMQQVSPMQQQTASMQQPTQTLEPIAKTNNGSEYFDYIKNNEGYSEKVYDDGVGNLTIGVGHLITPNSKSLFYKLFGDSVNFDDVKSGKTSLDAKQVKILFSHDVQEHLKKAKRLFNSFDSYPLYLRQALLDSVYRGDTGNNTRKLINQGKWEEAAVEYLNRRDYRNRVQLGIRGIGKRMEHNRDAMLKYAREKK